MTHPYAPWIIGALAAVICACLVIIWRLIRADRRERQQHLSDIGITVDWDSEYRALIAEEEGHR